MNKGLKALLHLKDPPRRTAIAFGTGVFIAFSPFLGLHTPLAIIVAFAFRLNRVAVLTGAWINFWALPPCYAFGTLIGSLLLGVDIRSLEGIDWDQADSSVWAALGSLFAGDWRQVVASFGSTLRTLFWPIMLGNMILGAVMGLLAYAIARRFLEARAHRHDGPGDDSVAPPAAAPPLA
ncbi:MAG: DUF2062 domain-containing protein [Vicinamibacteria bacterium]